MNNNRVLHNQYQPFDTQYFYNSSLTNPARSVLPLQHVNPSHQHQMRHLHQRPSYDAIREIAMEQNKQRINKTMNLVNNQFLKLIKRESIFTPKTNKDMNEDELFDVRKKLISALLKKKDMMNKQKKKAKKMLDKKKEDTLFEKQKEKMSKLVADFRKRRLDKMLNRANVLFQADITNNILFSDTQISTQKVIVKQLNQILGQQEKFTDETFKTNIESLSKNKEQQAQLKDIKWERPSKYVKNDKLCVMPSNQIYQDIQQGKLENSALLSALAVLRQKPFLIQRLFELYQVKDQGCYCMWLFVDGVWEVILIDDYFPVESIDNKIRPAFSRSKFDNELWVNIIEKCQAKAYGSYYNLGVSNYLQVINDLTGATTYQIQIASKQQTELFQLMVKNLNQNFLLSVMLKKQYIQTQKYAYPVLDVKQIPQNQSILIKIRDSWGQQKFTGEWQNGSQNWTEDMKKLLNYDDKDQSCWLTIKEFMNYFDSLQTIQIQTNYYQCYQSFDFSQNYNQMIHFKSDKNGKTFLRVTQPSKRKLISTYEDFEYSLIRVCLFQMNKGQVLKIIDQDFNQKKDIIFTFENLEAGYYSVMINVNWNQNYSRNIALSTYSEQKIEIKENSKIQENDEILDQLFKKQNSKFKNLKEGLQYKNGEFFGYQYYYFKNPFQQELKSNIDIEQMENIDVLNEKIKFKKINVTVGKEEDKLIKFKPSTLNYIFRSKILD